MIINTAGEYTLQYTATDACGNSTTVERDLVVEEPPTYRTVLYTDGTFIINESSRDEAHNVALHGQPTNVYNPFDPNGDTLVDRYEFSTYGLRPWDNQVSSITSVEIGSNIQPTLTRHWFENMTNLLSVDLDNLDTSAVTSMESMFNGCSLLETLDLSGFDTSDVISTATMFRSCSALKTIYASTLFVVEQVTSDSNMFVSASNLVGGAGTTYSSSYRDKTRARIDNPPDAPGYFTAKS